jgi:hypothetical protein
LRSRLGVIFNAICGVPQAPRANAEPRARRHRQRLCCPANKKLPAARFAAVLRSHTPAMLILAERIVAEPAP